MSEVVVVTGATSGVGRAVARQFGRQGCSVGLLARNGDGLQAVAKEIEAAGGRSAIVPVDVASFDEVEAAASKVEEALGPIDIWVNNAMTTVFAFFTDVEPDEYKRATDVTYLGFVWGTRAALKRMMPRDRGVIVQVGSALAYRGIPLQSPYCGAKHAIKGFHDSLRTELKHKGSNVNVTMVQLPGLNTPQFDHCRSKMPNKPMPVPPIYQPEVAAEAIVHAARHPRREYYVGGSTVATIWANKIVPALVDLYLARTNVAAQQTDEAEDLPRPGNLFDVVPGDPGAHGDFDGQAHERSIQSWASRNRAVVATATAAAAMILRRAVSEVRNR